MPTWRSKSCSEERALVDSGRTIVSSDLPQLTPSSMRLTSCKIVIKFSENIPICVHVVNASTISTAKLRWRKITHLPSQLKKDNTHSFYIFQCIIFNHCDMTREQQLKMFSMDSYLINMQQVNETLYILKTCIFRLTNCAPWL